MTDLEYATEQLRRDLDYTRDDVARLAAALADRAREVAPVAAASAATTAEDAVAKVREHPIPVLAAVATAISVTALVMWLTRSRKDDDEEQPQPPQFTPPYTPQPASRA